MDTALNVLDTHTVEKLGEKLGRLKTDFKEVVSLARNVASESFTGLKDSAIEKGKAATASVTSTIEENPLRSAIIAVGIGALVGFMVSRR